MRTPAVRVGAPVLLGAALLGWPAHLLRVDQVGAACASQPARPLLISCAVAYALAVALLGIGWRESLRTRLPLRTTFLYAALAHALALVFPPFLSIDPVFYAACGKALARGGGVMPLDRALPGDAWLGLLPDSWRGGTSPYFAGFNQLGRGIALFAGDRLGVALRAYQLLGAACTFGTAWLLQRCFHDPAEREGAAKLVLFSPLAIIEATQSGHNDALLMLSVALFAWATMRRRAVLGVFALAAGVAVKASALLILGLELSSRVLAPVRRLLTPRRVPYAPAALLLAATILVLAVLAAFIAFEARQPALHMAGALVGSPRDPWEHCTRSVECLPRALLRYVYGLPRAAWLIGLCFRALGGLWLLWAAARAAVTDASPAGRLGWISTALFVYYLLFHGYMQSWYLLPLVPLSAFAPPLFQPVMRLFTFTAVAYYPLDMLLGCSEAPIAVGARELFEAVITVALPGLYLLRRVLKARA